ncbi:MAG: hypothetical protein L3J21_09845 [Devosiaceae bacterium]|nr:hypothetical protein [Devosiaceae bacterium]
MNKVTIIADNGGGIILQVEADQDGGESKYQHYYEHQTLDAASDIVEALLNDDVSEWDGNDLDCGDEWLLPGHDDIKNSGVDILTPTDTYEVIEWGEGHAWDNIVELSGHVANIEEYEYS